MDGFNVLKLNNYGLQEGEGDGSLGTSGIAAEQERRALQANPLDAVDMQEDDARARLLVREANAAAAQRKAVRKAAARGSASAARRPRAGSVLQRNIKAAKERGLDWCSRPEQVEAFRPFLTKKVLAMLTSRWERRGGGATAAAGGDDATRAWPAQPAQICATMRPYQLRGLAFMRQCYAHGVNCILADEMGLGKTLQTISMFCHCTFELKNPGAHLAVVPLSVLPSWMNELKRWAPELRTLKIHTGDRKELERIKARLAKPDSYDVVVTTYDMAKHVDTHYTLTNTQHTHARTRAH